MKPRILSLFVLCSLLINGSKGQENRSGFSGTEKKRAQNIFIELGGQGLLFTANYEMSFSYRLQPSDGGFSQRAGLTPVFNKDFFIPYYAGLGLGFSFKS